MPEHKPGTAAVKAPPSAPLEFRFLRGFFVPERKLGTAAVKALPSALLEFRFRRGGGVPERSRALPP